MSSYISNLVHFVWATKNREPVIEPDWQDRLYGYLGGILDNKKCKLIAAGGVQDHVHVLASLNATVSLAEVAGALKANSSRWVHETIPRANDFQWQEGYGAFSVSKSVEPRVTDYIRSQAEHHGSQSFQSEFKALLDKHGIEYDDRYLWV